MREPLDAARIAKVLEAFGRAAERDVAVYLVGGTTAVLLGWRASTIDVDFAMRPEDDAILRAIPALKERLAVNVELSSPADFIPLPDGWEARSPRARRYGRVDVFHFDLYAQALAKIERGHRQDLTDVQAMLDRGLIEREALRRYFEEIEPRLYRFPAIDPASFRQAVAAASR